MKHINLIFVALSVVMLVLTGCSDKNSLTQPEINSPLKLATNQPDTYVRQIFPEKPAVFPIITYKNEKIGTLSVLYHDGFFHMTYQTGKGWDLHETSLHVAKDVKGIPINKEGIPVPEKFTYSQMHKSGLKQHTFVIPYNDYGFKKGQLIAIAAQVSVVEDKATPERARMLTGWAGKETGPGPQWWSYISYMFTGDSEPGGGIEVETQPVDRMYIGRLD